jgi:hypothetical protein
MERYDASSGQWSTVAAMGTARKAAGACVLAGELYVSGGGDGKDRYSSVAKYTPSTDTWSKVKSMPSVRANHAAVSIGPVMYVLGGGVDGAVSASVLKFDSAQNTWSEVAPIPSARFGIAACAIGSVIYVFGGKHAAGGETLASVFQFNTKANAWRTMHIDMPHASDHHHASVLGGLVYNVGAGGCEVLIFDPVGCLWKTLAPTSVSKQRGASFVLDKCLYVVGCGKGQGLASVECYDVASNTWTVAVANMLEERAFFGAVTITSTGLAASSTTLTGPQYTSINNGA